MVDLHNLYLWCKLIAYIFLGLLVWYIVIFAEYMRIFIDINAKKYEGLFFTIFNALLFGIYINVCGFASRMSKKTLKYIILVFFLYLISVGFGMFGIGFDFSKIPSQYQILRYYIYESNSEKGILFLAYNLYIFAIIYFVSFILESEIRD